MIRAWEAEIFRLNGELLIAMHPDAVDAAAQRYTDAVEIAQRQRARSLELRATTSLARLLQRQGRRKEAHQRLTVVLDWFTEGHDTSDRKTSASLVDELS